MDQLKKILNKTIALNGNNLVFDYLNDTLDKKSRVSNEPTLLEARQNKLDKDIREGTISSDVASLEQAQINAALQSLVNGLKEADIENPGTKSFEDLVSIVAFIEKEKEEQERRDREERERREKEERERREKEEEEKAVAQKANKTKIYAAMIALGLLAFLGGWLSDKLLNQGGSSETASKKVQTLEDALKKANASITDNNEQMIAYKLQEEKDKKEIDSLEKVITTQNAGSDNQTIANLNSQLIAKGRKLTACKDDLTAEEGKLRACKDDLAASEANKPTVVQYHAKVKIHCTETAWASNEVKKLKEKLKASKHKVNEERAMAGLTRYKVKTIEFMENNKSARNYAHAVAKDLAIDRIIGTSSISDSKSIHIYVP